MQGSAVHISGIRVAHLEGGEREVRVNRPTLDADAAIQWGSIQRREGIRVRAGLGQSGVRYWLVDRRGWRVMIETADHRTLEIGSARMQDHASALASMWEQAVLSGRVDV